MQGAAQGLYAVAGLPSGAFGQGFDNADHGIPWQHACDIVGDHGHDFAPTSGGQVGEDRRCDLPGHVGKGVAVEEEKRGATVTLPQELYGFCEGEDLPLLFRPLARARALSLLIKAVLRASSCARSSVEADDKLPTPVFEKSGSGL